MLLTRCKPIVSRDDTLKVPIKNTLLLVLHDFDCPDFTIDPSNININVPVVYLPQELAGFPLQSLRQLYKGNIRERVVFNPQISQTKKSVAEIITPVFTILNRRIGRYFSTKVAKLLYPVLNQAVAPFADYRYRSIHFILNADLIAKNPISESALKRLRFGFFFNTLKQFPEFARFVFDTFTHAFVTLVSGNKNVLHLCIYNKKYCKKPEDIVGWFRKSIPVINTLAKTVSGDEEFENTIQQTVDNVIARLGQIKAFVRKYENTIKQILKNTLLKYPELLDKITGDTKFALDVIKTALNIKPKEDEPVEITIVEKLNALEIPPVEIPDKLTNEDIYSQVKPTEVQVGNSVTFLEKSYETLEDQIKLFNVYLKKIGMEVVGVEKKPRVNHDIAPSEIDTYVITLVDEDGNTHEVELDLPKLVGNFFYYNGVKRALITQLYQMPVVSWKPHETMVRSNFSTFTVKVQTKFKIRSFFIHILGKQIPLIYLYVLYFGNLQKALDNLKIKYRISDNKCSDTNFAYQFQNNKWICIYPEDEKQELLVRGLEFYKLPPTDKPEDWKDFLSKKISIRFVKNIDRYFEEFIDPITYYVLEINNLPTDFIDLLNYAVDQAYVGTVTRQTDLRHRRFRNIEVLTVLMFKNLYKHIKEYQLNKQSGSKKQLKIPRDCVLKDLVVNTPAASQFQAINDDNPLIEASFLNRVTYAGLDGIPAEAVSAPLREVDPTYWGIIDPIDTPECLHPNTRVYKLDENDNQFKSIPLKYVKPGDKLLGKDGKIVTVLNVKLREKDAYKITLEDGSSIIASEDHLFLVYDEKSNVDKLMCIRKILSDSENVCLVKG